VPASFRDAFGVREQGVPVALGANGSS
jgi:hypothetical protein